MSDLYSQLILNAVKTPEFNMNYQNSGLTNAYAQQAANELSDYAPMLSGIYDAADSHRNYLNNLLKIGSFVQNKSEYNQNLDKAKAYQDEQRQKDFDWKMKLFNLQRGLAKQDQDELLKRQEDANQKINKAALERLIYQRNKEKAKDKVVAGTDFNNLSLHNQQIKELADEYNNTDYNSILDKIDTTEPNWDIKAEMAMEEIDANKADIKNKMRMLRNDTQNINEYRDKLGDYFYNKTNPSQRNMPAELLRLGGRFTGITDNTMLDNLKEYQNVKYDENNNTKKLLFDITDNPILRYYKGQNFRKNIFYPDSMSRQQTENLRNIENYMNKTGFQFIDKGFAEYPQIEMAMREDGYDTTKFEPIVTTDNQLNLIDKETGIVYDLDMNNGNKIILKEMAVPKDVWF